MITETKLTGLVDQLNSFGKKQLRINIAKTITLVIILTLFIWNMKAYLIGSAPVLIGLTWIFLSTTVFMILYWKNQFRISDLDLGETSINFIYSAIRNLIYQKKLNKVIFPIFGLSLLVGLNIIYLGFFPDFSTVKRILAHAGMSVILLCTLFLAKKIRERKFNKQYQPLINEMGKILTDLNRRK